MSTATRPMKKMAVIGAGITGVTTARALSARGFDVTVFDRHRYAAMETSFANGGQLSASNAEVWNSWGTCLKGMKWMMQRDAPLLVNPTPTWHKISWMLEFMRQIPNYRSNTVDTVRLAIAARELLVEHSKTYNFDFNKEDRGILHFYSDKSEYDHATGVNELYAEGGLHREAVAPEKIGEIEPVSDAATATATASSCLLHLAASGHSPLSLLPRLVTLTSPARTASTSYSRLLPMDPTTVPTSPLRTSPEISTGNSCHSSPCACHPLAPSRPLPPTRLFLVSCPFPSSRPHFTAAPQLLSLATLLSSTFPTLHPLTLTPPLTRSPSSLDSQVHDRASRRHHEGGRQIQDGHWH